MFDNFSSENYDSNHIIISFQECNLNWIILTYYEICKLAQEWNADLIVMGRRGHSILSELVLGSVSSYVIHRAHCSVHIVQD